MSSTGVSNARFLRPWQFLVKPLKLSRNELQRRVTNFRLGAGGSKSEKRLMMLRPLRISVKSTSRDGNSINPSGFGLAALIFANWAGEGPLVCGPRFASGDIDSQVRKFVQDADDPQPERSSTDNDRPSSGSPLADAPTMISRLRRLRAIRKLAHPIADAILDHRRAPLLASTACRPVQKLGRCDFQDRAAPRVDSGKHPFAGTRPASASSASRPAWRSAICRRIARRLEQGEIASS